MSDVDVELARRRLIHPRLNPLLSSLPDWVAEFRSHQRAAIERIVDAYSRVDVVVLSAPTGSGKTLIGETVGRLLELKRLYVCTSKSLQDQFVHDFPYAKVLKGRANYPTQLRPRDFHPNQWSGHVSADDCTWSLETGCKYCKFKSGCPYEIAKVDALRAELAVLNTSYLLAEANHVGKFSGNPFVIADEADTLEEALMGYVSVEVTERRLEQLGWDVPEKVTVPSSWSEWLDEHVEKLGKVCDRYPEVIEDIRVAREAKYHYGLLDKMQGVRAGMDTGAWVYTGRSRKDAKGKGLSFRPSRVDFLGKDHLWKHGTKWLLMSATIISSSEMLDSLGWDGSYETVEVANTFPVENRQVKVRGVIAMSHKNKDEARPLVAEGLTDILIAHPNNRVLVHTVSYDMTKYLAEYLNGVGWADRDVFAYLFADDKQRALEAYKVSDGGVLLAPSMERGVDLPGDLCRVQVIVKCPYPFLGDRQVSARLHSRDGKVWYKVQTIRALVQMCGRGVRSVDDHATTYILDSAFDRLWNEGRSLFPDWFKEAVVWR